MEAWIATWMVACLAVGTAARVAATATHPASSPTVLAVRLGDAFQAAVSLAPQRCDRVVVIGDSLMDNARPWLVTGLRDAGYTFHIDAQPSREIGNRRHAPYSGVLAARQVRATWGDADCWVIALGSNDLLSQGGEPAVAAALIDELLAELTPGARVWWMNVAYHRDPRYDVDFPRRTAGFNAAAAAAAAEGRVTLIDWYGLAEANPRWFFDPVHVDRTGSIARAALTVAALDS